MRNANSIFYPEPRGPRVLTVGELVLWYGMFAPCGRLLGTMGFAHGAPFILNFVICNFQFALCFKGPYGLKEQVSTSPSQWE